MAWVPLSAISEDREGDDYEFRSSMQFALHQLAAQRRRRVAETSGQLYDWAKKTLDQYVTLRDPLQSDYYPLMPYTQDQGAWMAWQFYSPEKGEGMIQAFRREQRLHGHQLQSSRGLTPDAVYTLKNIDTGAVTAQTGRALMENGLPLAIDKQPGATIVLFRSPHRCPQFSTKGAVVRTAASPAMRSPPTFSTSPPSPISR